MHDILSNQQFLALQILNWQEFHLTERLGLFGSIKFLFFANWNIFANSVLNMIIRIDI